MVFGKPLISQPVIRMKLADMASQIEAVHYNLDAITYQMNNLDFKMQNILLGGPVALLKYRATRVGWDVADHAAQIFGGRAITRTGMGKRTERFIKSVKYAAILAGSEEIMADLGIRQSMRFFDKKSKL